LTNHRYLTIFTDVMSTPKEDKQLGKKDRLVRALRKLGVARSREIQQLGISREYLRTLVGLGLVGRVGRGLYALPDADVSEHHTVVEAAKRVPQGVVCLLSALRFHGLTTQAPSEVWLAIHPKARRPTVDYPPIRIARFSGQALGYGVEEHRLEGVSVRVYSPAKTVADCFKYRNKIGIDVAIEALRDWRRGRRASLDDLWACAKVCRVANVIRPYLEAIA